jgi:hypothetical protein
MLGGIGALVLLVASSGCVGYIKSNLQYAPTRSELRTKAGVVARFGDPRRKTTSPDGLEAWYYLLTARDMPAVGPGMKGFNAVYLGVIPIWWHTTPDENVKVLFSGDEVRAVLILWNRKSGFLCGVVGGIHGVSTTCGSL